MADMRPELREALLKEDWELLHKQLLILAQSQLNQLKWRGAKRGLLPDGHDANSISSEAIAQIFEGDCKLVAAPYAPSDLQNELIRLVTNQIHNLGMHIVPLGPKGCGFWRLLSAFWPNPLW